MLTHPLVNPWWDGLWRFAEDFWKLSPKGFKVFYNHNEMRMFRLFQRSWLLTGMFEANPARWWHGNVFLQYFPWKCKVPRANGILRTNRRCCLLRFFQDIRICPCMMSSKDITSAVFRWCSLPRTSIKSRWFAKVHFRVHLLEIGLKLCCSLSSKLTSYLVIFEGSLWKVPSASCVLARTCRLTFLISNQGIQTEFCCTLVAYILQCIGKY